MANPIIEIELKRICKKFKNKNNRIPNKLKLARGLAAMLKS